MRKARTITVEKADFRKWRKQLRDEGVTCPSFEQAFIAGWAMRHERSPQIFAALSDLIDSIDEVQAFIDLEAGCNGEGSVVEACRAIGKPIPPRLAQWLAEDGVEVEE